MSSGVFVALATDCTASEAVAALLPAVPAGWPIQASQYDWGCLALAGHAFTEFDDVVVVGTAVAHPWGLPINLLSSDEIRKRYLTYGTHISVLAAGPFALADLRIPAVTSPVNGIIPLFRGHGARTVLGTHAGIVSALAGGADVETIPPGTTAEMTGTPQTSAVFDVREEVPEIDIDGLEREIRQEVATLGPPKQPDYLVTQLPSVIPVHRFGDALVALPPLDRETRTGVHRLWWHAGLRGLTVFVPALERPVLDALTLTGGPSSR